MEQSYFPEWKNLSSEVYKLMCKESSVRPWKDHPYFHFNKSILCRLHINKDSQSRLWKLCLKKSSSLQFYQLFTDSQEDFELTKIFVFTIWVLQGRVLQAGLLLQRHIISRFKLTSLTMVWAQLTFTINWWTIQRLANSASWNRHRRVKKQRHYERLAATSHNLSGNFSDISTALNIVGGLADTALLNAECAWKKVNIAFLKRPVNVPPD